MPKLNIFTGNIGSGKSVIASKLAKKGCAVVNMDTLQTMFSGGEYGNYDSEKREVYHSTENAAIESALEAGISVVIDRTNMDRKCRQRFIEIGQKHAAEIISYNWGSGVDDKHNLLERRLKNSRGIPRETWANVFKYMAKSYEVPSMDEGFDQLIEAPKTYKFYAFDFDGTIAEDKPPIIGEIINSTVDRMNALWENLSNIIIIWTCRTGDLESQARSFLLKKKIPFDFINENPIFETGSAKIFAHEYCDNRNTLV